MDTATINSALYRTLSSGTRYNKYFVASSCTPVKLNTGNTKVALSEMAKWVKKYSSHTAELAKKEFSNVSITSLPAAIHRFLYHHIQYKIDGYTQNLKSPACAWQTRTEGTDCKSFSLFAGSILLNLGVKFYFRRIKQAAIHPDAYTHVYVVVPNDQKTGNLNKGYAVIDATLKINKETPFIKKDDKMIEPDLPIMGLAAPGLGCACDGKPNVFTNIGTQPMAAPAYLGQPAINLGVKEYQKIGQAAWQGFEQFTNAIASLSPSRITVDKFKAKVSELLAQGIDPIFKITDKGIYVNDVFYNFSTAFQSIKQASSSGLGNPIFGGNQTIDAPVLTDIGQLPTGTVGSGSGSGSGGGIADTIASASGFGSLLSGILGKDFVNNTFGAIFANGFNLSCWNSSSSPSKAKAWVSNELDPFFKGRVQQINNSVNSASLANSLTQLDKSLKAIQAHQLFHKDQSKAKCSKEGNQMMADAADNYASMLFSIVAQLKQQGYQVQTREQDFVASDTQLPGMTISWKGKKITAKHTVYTITGAPSNTGGGNVNGGNTGGTTTGGASNLPDTKPSSMGTNIAMVALLIGGVVYGTKKFK